MKMSKNNSQSHQISDDLLIRWKAVLIRIQNANRYVEVNWGNSQAIEAAEKRFQEQVIPECQKLGIDESFAWALFFFGKEFLKTELAKR